MAKALTLRGCSHDQLIDEVRYRLDRGWFGYHGLMSTNQADHRDMWRGLLEWLYEMREREPDNQELIRFEQEMRRLADEHTPAPPFALNTTQRGRDISMVNDTRKRDDYE